jgi:hypothetical protein
MTNYRHYLTILDVPEGAALDHLAYRNLRAMDAWRVRYARHLCQPQLDRDAMPAQESREPRPRPAGSEIHR